MSAVPPVSVTPPTYPSTSLIDYPDKMLNRLTSFFRIFVAIPIFIIVGLLGSKAHTLGVHPELWRTCLIAGGLFFLPLVLMMLFRSKYPKWRFDLSLGLTKFSYRVISYAHLLRDEYPSIDEEQAVHLGPIYLNVQTELGRGWPLIKWFLAIPRYIVLFFLFIAMVFLWIGAWFAILFTGRCPKVIFEFRVGALRWALRVSAYAFPLITDKYPAFRLEPYS